MCWELGNVETAFEVGRLGTVMFIVRTWFFMVPGVVVSSRFTVVSEVSVCVKGDLGNSPSVVPLGGVPAVVLLTRFVPDTMADVVTDDFVEEVSGSDGVTLL